MSTTIQYKMDSKIGPLYLAASARGIRGVCWRKHASYPLVSKLSDASDAERLLARAVLFLEKYLQGEQVQFDLPLEFEGTDFQKSVWNALLQIPYGETRSYREIAKAIRNEGAVRAVGTANGRNPLAIFVPCHRVIASDGSLGGYAGGLQIKSTLLAIEQDSKVQSRD